LQEKLAQLESLLAKDDYAGARALVAGHIGLSPADRDAYSGAIEVKAGDQARAEQLLRRAIERDSNHILAKGNLAHLLVQQRKFKLALEPAESANKALPLNRNFAMTYAAVLSELDRHREAHECLAPVADRLKQDLRLQLTYAVLLRADLQPLAALEVLERLRDQHPGNFDVMKAIADAWSEIDPRKASEAFSEAAKLSPENLPLNWNRSFVELRLENFELGWKLYDAGLTDKIGKVGRPLPAIAKSQRLTTEFDELDEGKWSAFIAEQGLGDQVLFYSCMGEALRLRPKSFLIAEERMLPLLRRTFKDVDVFPYSIGRTLQFQSARMNGLFPIGALPKRFWRSSAEIVEKSKPFLLPNEKLVEQYKKILRMKHGNKKLIGLSWRGGFWGRQKRTKSFDLELLEPILKDSPHHYISLQYGDIEAEREYVRRAGLPITFVAGVDFKKDIDAWFSLICACDEVLSVSTAMVHFAGAAGKRVHLILSDHQSPFIWGLNEGPSLPYKSVIRYRPSREEPLEQFVRRVAGAVQ
jgi:hypothetical protein